MDVDHDEKLCAFHRMSIMPVKLHEKVVLIDSMKPTRLN